MQAKGRMLSQSLAHPSRLAGESCRAPAILRVRGRGQDLSCASFAAVSCSKGRPELSVRLCSGLCIPRSRPCGFVSAEFVAPGRHGLSMLHGGCGSPHAHTQHFRTLCHACTARTLVHNRTIRAQRWVGGKVWVAAPLPLQCRARESCGEYLRTDSLTLRLTLALCLL